MFGRMVSTTSLTISRKSNSRRRSEALSTATCLKLRSRSEARCRERSASDVPSRHCATKCASVERFMFPFFSTRSNSRVASPSAEVVINALPIGVLSSWATPATSCPKEANFSDCTSSSCARLRVPSVSVSSAVRCSTRCSNCSLSALISDSIFRRSVWSTKMDKTHTWSSYSICSAESSRLSLRPSRLNATMLRFRQRPSLSTSLTQSALSCGLAQNPNSSDVWPTTSASLQPNSRCQAGFTAR